MIIALKDLAWKANEQEKSLESLRYKYNVSMKYKGLTNYSLLSIYSKEFIKEYEETLKKTTEYTKQDIIDMFLEAGMELLPNGDLKFEELYIKYIGNTVFYFKLETDNDSDFESDYINFNDKKRIEFYYNTFRNILDFEANKED